MPARLPAVSLGRPLPLGAAVSAPAEGTVRPVAYQPTASRRVVRAQGPDTAPPTLAPPAGAVFPSVPVTPAEQYNCGVITRSQSASGPSFWERSQQFIETIPGLGGCPGRRCLESDHAFDNFISPVTNPFFFEDPRSLTELRPVFIYQDTRDSNWIFQGGDVNYFGIQARLALTERLSFVMNKFGVIWSDPKNEILGFEDAAGFSEVYLGPKYTFLRNEDTRTLGAAGLTFQIPAGPSKVFQDTGSLSLTPYVSFGQNFGRTSYGSFNVLNTTGYNFRVDNKRSESFFTSLHLDFDVANLQRIYPLVELNYWHYVRSGKVSDVGFEGRDLFNFGSRGVSGTNALTIAAGARYKFSENIQTGLAAEFPLVGGRDLTDFRLTVDLILRY
jgi:hypothetical protein